MEVILRLRALREQKNVSQVEVANYLGISPGQLGNIESSKQNHKYTLNHIHLLCEWFGEPIGSIFCVTASPSIDDFVKHLIVYEENVNHD